MNRLTLLLPIFLTAGLACLAQPVSFERNQGQTDPSVQYLARTANYRLFLTDRTSVLALNGKDGKQPSNLTVRLIGSNAAPRTTALEEQRGVSNYLTGADPDHWVTGVKRYAKVRYAQVYPGIDLVYYGKEQQLEHDFIVAPGADYRNIRVRFEGPGTLQLATNGDLVMKTPSGELRQLRPEIYQEIDGARTLIAGGYRVSGRNVSFRVDAYDTTLPLVIDPVLFSTYLGGNGSDQPTSTAVDSQGGVYVTGTTTSTNFPTKGPIQSSNKAQHRRVRHQTRRHHRRDRLLHLRVGGAAGSISLAKSRSTGLAETALCCRVH